MILLFLQRFREMFRRASLAQHDRKKKGFISRGMSVFRTPVIPSEVEESRGNEPFDLFLILAFSKRRRKVD